MKDPGAVAVGDIVLLVVGRSALAQQRPARTAVNHELARQVAQVARQPDSVESLDSKLLAAIGAAPCHGQPWRMICILDEAPHLPWT
ncbi:MAG: hypothetical protein HY815_31215 [Candidatus Riflebacteria bacterium]|nr:hypothetical protein [Candidatus Riflebacteria bacterium]